MVVPSGTSTEVLRQASTAGLTAMPAALLRRERRLQPVAERQAELRQERAVVRMPVREEVPPVLPGRPTRNRAPHPCGHATSPEHGRMCFTRLARNDDTRSMLAVVKPSPLRLWGFLLTVIGGALVAFGSIGNWAAITLGGSSGERGTHERDRRVAGQGHVDPGRADRDRDPRVAVRASRTPQRDGHRDHRGGIAALVARALGAPRAEVGRAGHRRRRARQAVGLGSAEARSRSSNDEQGRASR